MSDHAKYAREYLTAGIPVFKPYECEDLRKACDLGGYFIQSFPLVHDVPCCGFLVDHPEMGRLLYASDTEYIRYRFQGLNHILVEANYSKELIDQNAPNRNHVLEGHMELETTIAFLEANDSPELMTVVLCHLSDKNADPVMFRRKVSERISCPVLVAGPRFGVELKALPF